MSKRRTDADHRRFFDEFECVKIPRLRATGVVQLDAPHAVIQFDDKPKLIALAHVRFRNGGSWSLFRCPKCARRANRLWLVEDRPLCVKCCNVVGVQHRSRYALGRTERLRARDRALDELQTKLDAVEPLRFNGAPASWGGRAQQVYRSRRLTERMRRSMIVLRLNQLASQQAKNIGGCLDITRTYRPRAAALAAVPDLGPIWRADTAELLEQALDKAQVTILEALQSSDARQRLTAASLMLKTRAARQRGLG
jgi:hypothetical protein